MPLHPVSERAALQVETVLARLDRQIAGYLVDGGRLPTVGRVMAPITVAVERSVIAALREVGATVTTRAVRDGVEAVVTPIRAAVVAAVAEARRARRRVPVRAPKGEPVTDGSNRDLIRKAGAGAALLILLARRTKKQQTPDMVRKVAREVGLRPPRLTSAYGKMVVRTQTAIVRNETAGAVVSEANLRPGERWALMIRDGLNGPTDHECERVDGRLATVEWIRRHTVAH